MYTKIFRTQFYIEIRKNIFDTIGVMFFLLNCF